MKINPAEFRPAVRHSHVSSGTVIRTLRELKGWTQEELSRRCGISATNLSMLENDRVDIGKKRAELIAKAFAIHPAIIMFPEYEAFDIAHAA
ncbi:MAG: helix-turn-helix transcriptional regulator [Elusimicrobia bacterium]|nr:helix-turn-helix transcriptional regulator [Elusimicrobiota bacterium]